MYYGQFQDDRIIEEYFDNNYVGGCIDIGATDGVTINNTKYFEDKGWYCLCIEPNPNSFDKLKNNRKNTLKLAVSDYNKDLVDFTIVNLNDNSIESEGAISSLSIDKNLYQKHLDMGFNLTTKNIEVSVRTLDFCVDNYYNFTKIDFVSIDTEGTELNVLKGFNINKWQPKLIVLENNYNESIFEEYLKQFGYIKDKRVGVNDYFLKIKKKNFLVGPKLGDFFHSLYVVKCLSESKSDVYITGNFFSNGLENTYKDIYNIVIKQPYIDNFLIYNNQHIDVNVDSFYMSDILFTKNWTNIFKGIFNLSDRYENEKWLYKFDNDYDKYDVILHFSKNRYHPNYNELLLNIIENNSCIFISNSEQEYNDFIFKDKVKFRKCKDFSELYYLIQNCKFFVGNQSMPLAIAHGMFKNHLGFLYGVDTIHYIDDFNKNYFWMDNNNVLSKNFDEINNFIKVDKIIKKNPDIDTDNVTFNIWYQKQLNKVNIDCNSNIEVYVNIFEYDKINDKKIILYRTATFFNKNSYWYAPESKHLKDVDFIKVEIIYYGKFLKEEIIQIV
jgi:FkbM family methyltransferase